MNRTCAIAFVTLLSATTLSAQAPNAPLPATSPASFEVASIKPSPPIDPSNPLTMVPLPLPRPGGRFTATSTPLKMLVGMAFEMPDFRVSGGPAALMSARFDITAKADSPDTLSPKQLAPMIRNLLIERFKLKSHIESREMPVYDLVVARSDGRLGPDLKPSTSDCSKADEINAARAEALSKGDLGSIVTTKAGEVQRCTMSPNVSGGPTNISMHGDGMEIKQLVEVLTQLTGRPVFDFKLDLQMMLAVAQGMGVPVPGNATIPQSDGTSLMTAINEQLGLKLESTRAPFEVLVVDSVEAPTPD